MGLRTRISNSVLVESRERLCVAHDSDKAELQFEMTNRVTEADYHSVGMILHGGEIDYHIWALFGVPSEELCIEWIAAGTSSACTMVASFQSCAVFCLECP